jgi:hypothetical protein
MGLLLASTAFNAERSGPSAQRHHHQPAAVQHCWLFIRFLHSDRFHNSADLIYQRLGLNRLLTALQKL